MDPLTDLSIADHHHTTRVLSGITTVPRALPTCRSRSGVAVLRVESRPVSWTVSDSEAVVGAANHIERSQRCLFHRQLEAGVPISGARVHCSNLCTKCGLACYPLGNPVPRLAAILFWRESVLPRFAVLVAGLACISVPWRVAVAISPSPI